MTDKLADHLAYPPRALRAERAAAYLSMSTAMFLKLDCRQSCRNTTSLWFQWVAGFVAQFPKDAEC